VGGHTLTGSVTVARIHVLSYSLDRYLLSLSLVPATILSVEDRTINKRHANLCSWRAYSLVEENNINKISTLGGDNDMKK
jgi:hypothetical protein